MAKCVQLYLRGKQYVKKSVQVTIIDQRHRCEPFALQVYIYDQAQWPRSQAAALVQAHVIAW